MFEFTTEPIIANSYMDLSEAESYISHQPDTDMWDNYASDVKEFILVRGSLAIDSSMRFAGEKKDENQVLSFPRESDPSVPMQVKLALAMICISLSNDELFSSVTSETIGKLSWDYSDVSRLIGEEAFALLKPLSSNTVSFKVGQN